MEEYSTQTEQQNQMNELQSTARRPMKRGLFAVVALIVMLVVAGFVARNQMYRITTVEISGLRRMPYGDVLNLAGIGWNTSSLNLDEEKIREGINSNIYLDFRGYEKLDRNTIRLYVYERENVANVLYNGLQFTTSADGMVLSRSGSLALDNGCVTVTGMNLRDIRVASYMACHNESQMEAFIAVFEELELQKIRSEVAELNFSSLDSIYLVTTDGYTVNLGNVKDLRGKIGTMRAAIAELKKRGLKGGMLECSVSGIASYRPVE